MTDTTFYLLSDARKALKSHHLLSGIHSLKGMATLLKAWNESEELDSISESYHTLLSYYSQGIQDPERVQLYNRFICRSYELSDALERLNELKNESSLYTTCYNTLQKLKGTDVSLSKILQKEAIFKDIFHAVWLSGPWHQADETYVNQFLTDQSVDIIRKCLVISATTLSAMKFFDIAKLRTLTQYITHNDDQIRARALTGVIFIIFCYPDRLLLYPSVHAQLQLALDKPSLVHEVELIQAQLFLSLQTKRIEQNIQEEIIPQMMKRMESLKLNRSIGIEELKERLAEADLNPEWEADGQPSKLAEYMKEFADLQKKGADLYLGTFKILKQRFPFFKEISNWFCPFIINHPEIPVMAEKNKTLNLILNDNNLCDSDKYSFCLIADQLKNAVPDEVMEGLTAGKDMGLPPMQNTIHQGELFKKNIRSYIQGFYRFCNLFVFSQQFPNPFQRDVFIANYVPFKLLLNNQNWLIRMADLTFKDESYQLSRSLYERIPQDERTPVTYQKIGFCYEQTNNINEAIQAYTLAYDSKPSDTWTLKRLSANLRQVGRFKEALFYYDILSEKYPEDANIAFRQGECYLNLKDYDNAFKALFKADYIQEGTGKTMRALAWCSLLTKKYVQAERYYTKILEKSPTPTDFLNAGHAAWLMGNRQLAISRYTECISDEYPENFLQEDTNLLMDNGITTDELYIMTDAVLNHKSGNVD